MLAAGAGALLPAGAGTLCSILLEVCSGCDLASRTGRWGSLLCCAALSVQGLSVLLQVRTYEEGRLCLEFAGGLFTVYGDGLRIETLAAHRITLRGRFLRTDFSSD